MDKLSLLTKSLERTYLKTLHERYVKRFGHLAHKLDEYTFYAFETPSEIAIKLSESETWYPTLELAESLEKQGFVRFSENNVAFFLTELGYRTAEQGRLGIILTWLNSNQGVIAAAAFIISIVALFFGN